MSSLDNDPWVARRRVFSPAKLHALGLITVKWNLCEYWAQAMFGAVLIINQPMTRVVVHDLGDITIWKKILDIARARNIPAEMTTALEHAFAVYERCRQNRNQYVHAGAGSASASDEIDDGSVLVMIRMKGPQMDWPRIADSLSDVRRVVEDMERLQAYLEAVFMHVHEGLRGFPADPLPDPIPIPDPVWAPPPREPRRTKRSRPSDKTGQTTKADRSERKPG